MKKTHFWVTGFGKFGNILENPTTYLVKALPDILKQCAVEIHLDHTEVIDVSI